MNQRTRSRKNRWKDESKNRWHIDSYQKSKKRKEGL